MSSTQDDATPLGLNQLLGQLLIQLVYGLIVFADITNLNDVLTILEPQFPKSKWMRFGLKCGLHYNTLNTIKADNHNNTEECFTECVACWLRKQDDVGKKEKLQPSLQRLADIVRKVGDIATADKIISQIKKKKMKGTHKLIIIL